MKRYHFLIFVSILGVLLAILVCFIEDCRSLPKPSASSCKIAHISFDDVVGVLKELKEKSDEYDSIFECSFLNDLKVLHDRYGAKFSLYVYEKDGDFNISEMPLKYRDEFKEHALWLKFGFHSMKPEFHRNMKYMDFRTSFLNVCRAICCFADTTSLSSVLRLHYFFGNDSIVSFINDSGITGLLCADDDRDSYDLNEEENELLRRKFYLKRGVEYFKTDLRYENIFCINRTLERMRNRDTLVLFTHEWAYRPLISNGDRAFCSDLKRKISGWWVRYKLEKSIQWLREHGYEFVFL